MSHQHPRQDGATLLIALGMLAILLLLGASATRLLMLEQHGATHWRGQMAAQLAAQAALDDALLDLRSGSRRDALARQQGFPANTGCDGSDGLCRGTATTRGALPAHLASDYATPYGRYTGQTPPATDNDGVAPPPPRYLIEQVVSADALRSEHYRINAIGHGPGGAVALLQTVVERVAEADQASFVLRAWRPLPPGPAEATEIADMPRSPR